VSFGYSITATVAFGVVDTKMKTWNAFRAVTWLVTSAMTYLPINCKLFHLGSGCRDDELSATCLRKGVAYQQL